jgi:hypothetical protein
MNRILYPLISILVVALVTLIFLLYNEKLKMTQLLDIQRQSSNTTEESVFEQKSREMELFFNGQDITKKAILSDGKGNSIEWDEITDNKNKLILYFSEGTCDLCLNAEISRLNENADLVVSDNAIILISAISKRYVAQYKNDNKLKFPVFEIKSSGEKILPPGLFYFVIEKESKRINSAFFPSKYKPAEADRYLNDITGKYFGFNANEIKNTK